MKFYSQYGQDRFVYENFFKEKKNGFFIEIGADDGIRFSNCKFFEEFLDWNGIAIEPRLSAYNKLIENRKCICLNELLSNEIKEVEFLELKGYGLGLSGIINDYDKRHVERINREIKNKDHLGKEILKIKTNTLDLMLSKNNIKYIDFLSIDTEGSELKILETIDFDKIFIDVITIEDNYNDPKLTKFFLDRGYKFIKQIKCDKIFKHN